MTGAFGGAVADYYARYRRGYPSTVIDGLARALQLSRSGTIVDVGCGTGRLTLPLAATVGHVIGVDPEPDMLRLASTAQQRSGIANVSWIKGTAQDLATIATRCDAVDAVTLANTIHLVDRSQLFHDAGRALRPGGSLVIIANGTPLWLQDTPWSRTLRGFLEHWLDTELVDLCGTDEATRSIYRRELHTSGYATEDLRVDYTDTLTLDQIVGGVFSAMSSRLPPPQDRSRFSSRLGAALSDGEPYTEQVTVRCLIAHAR